MEIMAIVENKGEAEERLEEEMRRERKDAMGRKEMQSSETQKSMLFLPVVGDRRQD